MNIIKLRKEIILPMRAPNEQLEGWFKIDIIKPDGRRVPAAPWQKNLITNAGMDNFADGTKNGNLITNLGWINHCWVGVGSTAPAFTDIDLDTRIANQAANWPHTNGAANTQLQGAPYYRWQRQTYTFSQGQAIGTWTEIGLGPQPGQLNGISTRALIVDGNGDPTTIVVGASDQVEVTYEIRTYITQLTQIDEQMTIDNVLYDMKRLPFGIDDAANMNGAFMFGSGIDFVNVYKGNTTMPNAPADPWDQTVNHDSMENRISVLQPYAGGTHYHDSVLTCPYDTVFWGPVGITGFRMRGNLQSWHVSFTQNADPTKGIPKDNTNELVMTFRHTWARYTPP